MEEIAVNISLASLVIAIITIAVSYYTFQQTIRIGFRPVLVFSRRTAMHWQIENVGNGPAVSLMIGAKNREGKWMTIVDCYPVSAGTSLVLKWLPQEHEVAAVYTDVHGKTFTTHFQEQKNAITEKNKFPDWKPVRLELFYNAVSEIRNKGCLTDEDLNGKTPWELTLMRNEYYARYGYKFKREDLRQHFSALSWYEGTSYDELLIEANFSDVEKYNAHFILNYQMRENKTGLSPKK